MNEIIKHLTDPRVKRCLSMTAAVKRAAEDFLFGRGFEEIDTPILMPRTGEVYNETFNITLEGSGAMLADSPQIYKMLLTKAGYEKYFQFAHCFRATAHESEQHTRLSEFIQLDLELRDTNLDALIELAKELILHICKTLRKTMKTVYIDGLECRSKYGSAMNPDLRESNDELSMVIVKRMPLTNDGRIPCHHIFAKPSAPELIKDNIALTETTTESFDIIMNGVEVGGGDMRINDSALQRRMMRLFGVDESCYPDYFKILEDSGGEISGGFALGLERVIMILSNSENICQTTAFPNYYKRGVN